MGEAFDRGRDFAAWIGLVPRQHSTGGKPILGRMSKRGSKYLRTLFIQSARILLMRPHNWKKFSFGPWLEQARVAWSVLRHGKNFDQHRNSAEAV